MYGSLVLVPDSNGDVSVETAELRAGNTLQVLAYQHTNPAAVPEKAWHDADAVMLWHRMHLDAEAISLLENCKVIVRMGTGYDNIDMEAATEKGIPVCNVPDYGTDDVADHALAMIMAFHRGLVGYNEHVRNGGWSWAAQGLQRTNCTRVGIVGLGRIGTNLALKLKALGFVVAFYDPYVPNGIEKALGIRRFPSVYALAQDSDYMSIHCNLTDETRGMINADVFSKVNPLPSFPMAAEGTGIKLVVNTARGEIVDLDALHDAMKDLMVVAAGLDVLPKEPSEHPLIQAWQNREKWIENRLIVTPHAAFYNKQSIHELKVKGAKEVERALRGEKLRNQLNKTEA